MEFTSFFSKINLFPIFSSSFFQSILTTQHLIPTTELRLHASDTTIIKELKAIGNRILESCGAEYRAWRIDFNKLFEQYVQFILGKVAITQSAKAYNNKKYSISGGQTNWTLSHLEPDIILKTDDRLSIVDAKYKTHMLNSQSSKIEDLHNTFRHDLHQVLAYSIFDPTSKKITMLVYPSIKFHYISQIVSTPLSSVCSHVYLIGIPFGRLGNSNNKESISAEKDIRTATEGFNSILASEFK